LDPAFVADCPYSPEGLLIDDILEVDVERSLVRARMPTSELLPLTRTQRVHPVRHPQHVSGGLMVHMTGMLGFVHAYWVFGLRHAEGWTGYGGRIHHAGFKNLGVIGPPLELKGWCTSHRRNASRIVARYSFEFTQEGKLVYEGDQTAMWMKVD
jgi:hypothetical protein